MNRVDWILDSGASLHFTGDMNDFIEYTPLEKNITANTATSANTQIIGKGTVMMAVEGVMIFAGFLPFFFLSPKRPLIQLHSTMTCFHIPYLILSHVPFLLSYLSSSFGYFG